MRLLCLNSVDGSTRFRAEMGWFRLVCSNGLGFCVFRSIVNTSLVDATTGEVVRVELFVGVLGASGLIDAEATRSQELAAWVDAHVRMVEYFGGSPA